MTGRLIPAGIAALLSALLAGCASSPPPDGKGPAAKACRRTSSARPISTARSRSRSATTSPASTSCWTSSTAAIPANGARPTPPTSRRRGAGQARHRGAPPPPGLSGLRDIQILAVSLDPNYSGDRVAAFIYGLADTIIAAHNGKTRLYVSDALDGQRVYNAARNVEAAAWLLASRHNSQGEPLLANEMSQNATNLSFERVRRHHRSAGPDRQPAGRKLPAHRDQLRAGLAAVQFPAGAVGRGAQSSRCRPRSTGQPPRRHPQDRSP